MRGRSPIVGDFVLVADEWNVNPGVPCLVVEMGTAYGLGLQVMEPSGRRRRANWVRATEANIFFWVMLAHHEQHADDFERTWFLLRAVFEYRRVYEFNRRADF